MKSRNASCVLDALPRVSPMPISIPEVIGTAASPAAPNGFQAHARVLIGRAGVRPAAAARSRSAALSSMIPCDTDIRAQPAEISTPSRRRD